ncbi:MAG: F-box protein [Alphaproteobacteria bacterium]|nr:F-box protein [Alphaproteobacteria bacterium]
MKIMKKIFVFITIVFSFNCLHAMETIEESTLNELEGNSSRRPLLRLNQSGDIEEEQEDISNYFCSPFFLLNSLDPCWSVVYRWGKASTSIKNERVNILMLPPELIWNVADFLSSVDIIRLSAVCKKFHQVFNESYWVSYLSRKPQAHSCLMLNGTLSPSLQRKTFFSHLWYTENRISLAARLGHPEAVILQKYGSYGAYIGKDQYLCPSGVIKYASGKIDDERTSYYRDAQRKQIEADLERRERLMVSRKSIGWRRECIGW